LPTVDQALADGLGARYDEATPTDVIAFPNG